MRARTLVLLLLAVILAGGTALLARSWLSMQKNDAALRAAPAALPTPAKSVLVARNDIRRGQILRPEDMGWEGWPEGGIVKSYIILGGPQKPETFAGWVARNPIGAGEPITESRIVAPGNRGFLAAVLRPGMRAISVPVTLTSGISGFIFPGDRVDLLMTYAVPPQGAAEATKASFDHKAAETVLQNIRVIAIDQRMESKAGEAVVAHTATFEVTPKQSEIIALASEIGKVSLTLRSLTPMASETPNNDDLVPSVVDQSPAGGPVSATPTLTLDDEISPLFPKVVSKPNSPSASNVVTILRGATRTAVVAAATGG